MNNESITKYRKQSQEISITWIDKVEYFFNKIFRRRGRYDAQEVNDNLVLNSNAMDSAHSLASHSRLRRVPTRDLLIYLGHEKSYLPKSNDR